MMNAWRKVGWAGMLCGALHGRATAQNIVDFGAGSPPRAALSVIVSDPDLDQVLTRAMRLARPTNGSECVQRAMRQLDRHVVEFLDGAPWMPFQQTLGISGYETAFAHPDEVVTALALATPLLPEPTATRTRRWLVRTLEERPPEAVDGWDFAVGRPRESHDIPAALRRAGRGRAGNLFGLYALWASAHYAGQLEAVRGHWSRAKDRARGLWGTPVRAEAGPRLGAPGDAERVNGDLAGLIGLVRLAKLIGDAETEEAGRRRCREWLEARINLDRTNATLLEPSRAATKSLHNARLGRLLYLAPEVGEALATRTDGGAAADLRAFRERRNGWYLAWGDRFVGGENFSNPIHVPWAMFAGAVFIEKLPSSELCEYLDVPWCRGDFAFVQKCVLTVWVATGRRWEELW